MRERSGKLGLEHGKRQGQREMHTSVADMECNVAQLLFEKLC